MPDNRRPTTARQGVKNVGKLTRKRTATVSKDARRAAKKFHAQERKALGSSQQ